MTELNTAANIERADDIYERLIEAHAGLDEHQSRELNSRLILLLINQIGDADVIFEAIDRAKALR